ncbi:unnamed protein product [Polarella glacialis]|uniref:Uncharacterized protein n=1 Tax=Polarella glacialis TaxID=89957 RepID=A0A813LU22_POLGL|nr:unnamed protein product [Polarella glacialis]
MIVSVVVVVVYLWTGTAVQQASWLCLGLFFYIFTFFAVLMLMSMTVRDFCATSFFVLFFYCLVVVVGCCFLVVVIVFVCGLGQSCHQLLGFGVICCLFKVY